MQKFVLHLEGAPATELELSSIAEAKCAAARYAGTLLCDPASPFCDGRDFSITVADGDGLTLFTLQIIGTDAPVIQHIHVGRPPTQE